MQWSHSLIPQLRMQQNKRPRCISGDLVLDLFTGIAALFSLFDPLIIRTMDMLVSGLTNIVVTSCLLCEEAMACFKRSIDEEGKWLTSTGEVLLSYRSGRDCCSLIYQFYLRLSRHMNYNLSQSFRYQSILQIAYHSYQQRVKNLDQFSAICQTPSRPYFILSSLHLISVNIRGGNPYEVKPR